MSSVMFAALSAALTHFFFTATIGLLMVVWRDRRLFAYWRVIEPRMRDDIVLPLSLAGVLLIAGYHRALATYNFAAHHWRTTAPASASASIYLPLHLLFMAGILWWLCRELCGPACGVRVWFGLLGSGLFLAVLTIILA